MISDWRELLPPNRAWLIGESVFLALTAAGCLWLLTAGTGEAAGSAALRSTAEFADLKETEREQLRAAFPGAPATPEGTLAILGELAGEAAELGLSLAEHSLLPVSSRSERVVQPVTLHVLGRSPALCEFLGSISRGDLPLRIRSFHIEGGKSADERDLKLNLEILLQQGVEIAEPLPAH